MIVFTTSLISWSFVKYSRKEAKTVVTCFTSHSFSFSTSMLFVAPDKISTADLHLTSCVMRGNFKMADLETVSNVNNRREVVLESNNVKFHVPVWQMKERNGVQETSKVIKQCEKGTGKFLYKVKIQICPTKTTIFPVKLSQPKATYSLPFAAKVLTCSTHLLRVSGSGFHGSHVGGLKWNSFAWK